jgi:hypothetical protein
MASFLRGECPRLLTTLAVGVALLAGCSSSGDETAVIDPGDGGSYAPVIDPSDFVEEVTNPYLPLSPGTRWAYEGKEDGETERVEVLVTDQRRQVMGVPTIVVQDRVYQDGELIEDTLDWFAQDAEGNVWYFGEESEELEDGEVISTAGSWEAGVDGALPGIVMLADPTPGEAYRQEYYAGEAEDLAEVAGVSDSVSVPAGDYSDVLVIREWNPLEPNVVEEKYHAPGVGVVLEVVVEGGEGRVELINTR